MWGVKLSNLELLRGIKARYLLEVMLINELNQEWSSDEELEIPNEQMETRIAQMAEMRKEHFEQSL